MPPIKYNCTSIGEVDKWESTFDIMRVDEDNVIAYIQNRLNGVLVCKAEIAPKKGYLHLDNLVVNLDFEEKRETIIYNIADKAISVAHILNPKGDLNIFVTCDKVDSETFFLMGFTQDENNIHPEEGKVNMIF